MDILICWLAHLVLLSTLPIHILPDGAVYDPSNSEQPFGFVEIKCPYSARETTPYEAAQSSGFFCIVNSTGDIVLKDNHAYSSQV